MCVEYDENGDLIKASKEKQMAEAKLRMEILEIFPITRRQFLEDGKLSYSTPPAGAYFWMNAQELEAVQAFEAENHALVYTVIRSAMDDMFLDSLLYVSAYECEWEQERKDLRNGTSIARVLNRSYPHLSDTGYINFELGIAGGLIRTA